MDSFFHTYHIGGFVSTHEIARRLCELVTGENTEWLRAAFVIRNSATPEEIAAGMDELSASGDPQDRRLFIELRKKPIDESYLLYAESQVDQWDLAIRNAAKERMWACADLRCFAPVEPSSDDGYFVRVVDVIKLINDLKYPPFMAEHLEMTLTVSQERHGESACQSTEPAKKEPATTSLYRPEPSKQTAPADFSEPFEKVLGEIERVSKGKRIQFDRKSALCGYEDLQKFALLMNSSFPEYSLETFSKYARMCGVGRAKKGRPKKSGNNFLPELFPALYENQ